MCLHIGMITDTDPFFMNGLDYVRDLHSMLSSISNSDLFV